MPDNSTMSSMLDSLEILAESPDDGKIVLAFGDLPQKLDTWLTGAESTLSEVDTTLGDLTELREDIEEAVEAAGDAKTDAETHASNAEAWAAGTRGGIDVDSEDPAYHNNAKYYVDQISGDAAAAAASATAAAASATAAAGSESNAADSADEAASSAASATASATAAAASQEDAEDSATAAAASQEAAAVSATAASTAATAASGSAISADSARTRAISAATDAQSAATEASSSQVAAESARDAAVTAKNTAVTAKDDAVAAKTAAESAQTAAAASQTAAASSATSASGSATAASSSAASAAASATAADDSASAAAQSAEDAQDVLDSIPPDYTTTVQEVSSLKSAFEQLNDNVIVDSAGPSPIVSVTDGADGMPMRKVEVAIEPVQDLHGYEFPWPAGGGKNVFYHEGNITSTANGLTATFDGDSQTISITGTNTGTSAYILLNIPCTAEIPRETPLSRALINIPSGVYVNLAYRKNGMWLSVNNGDTIHAETDADTTINFQIGIYASATTLNVSGLHIQIERGSTAPTTWTPYSNVCPISGWTGAKVTRTGANILDEEFELGTIYSSTGLNGNSTDRIRTKNYIPIRPETTYYIKSTNGESAYFRFYDEGKTYLGSGSVIEGATNRSITTPAGAYYLRFYMGTSYGTTYNHDISINYPATDTEYHAYQGQTYEVTFPADPGTVYGGTLDVVSGKLVMEYAKETKLWSQGASSGTATDIQRKAFYPSARMDMPKCANAKCNIAKTLFTFGVIGFYPYGMNQIYLTLPTSTDGNTSIEYIFPLATPITYQLTPTEIKTLLGANNIWSDAGNTAITYPADTKLYIDNKIAELQALILENNG